MFFIFLLWKQDEKSRFQLDYKFKNHQNLAQMEHFTEFVHQKKIKLRSCESTVLNLRVKIKLPDEVRGIIGLLPSFIVKSLTIENCKRITSETSDELVKLELLNRNFHNTISIKKNQEIAGLILLHNDNESFVTRHKTL